mmetsp:Transcript_51832/g.83656  ORF Transcript_51832/g.83656 Transcript_51832/m.83656 type:complete len:231 (+) Transcript_51832:1364-2056(+)
MMSLLIMTPLSTRDSSSSPPGIFSTLAYLLTSISFLPSAPSIITVVTASSARSIMSLPNRFVYLVPTHVEMIFVSESRSLRSTGNDMFSACTSADFSDRKNACVMTVGWILRSSSGSATCSISPARMMTEVVPSPTSSSWARESSIMLLAAGCLTSISRRIAWPSFVITMPPIGSRSIFNMDRGPRVVRMMSATALAAAMFALVAFLPVSLLEESFMTITGADMVPDAVF